MTAGKWRVQYDRADQLFHAWRPESGPALEHQSTLRSFKTLPGAVTYAYEQATKERAEAESRAAVTKLKAWVAELNGPSRGFDYTTLGGDQ